jgi:hypothetical protein
LAGDESAWDAKVEASYAIGSAMDKGWEVFITVIKNSWRLAVRYFLSQVDEIWLLRIQASVFAGRRCDADDLYPVAFGRQFSIDSFIRTAVM